jgi:hypothetical protein
LTAAAGGSQTTRFERFTLQASTSGGGIDCVRFTLRTEGGIIHVHKALSLAGSPVLFGCRVGCHA